MTAMMNIVDKNFFAVNEHWTHILRLKMMLLSHCLFIYYKSAYSYTLRVIHETRKEKNVLFALEVDACDEKENK